jgi:hypothetical protein
VLAFTARRLAGTAMRLAIAVRAEVSSSLDGTGLPELVLEPLTEHASAEYWTCSKPVSARIGEI